MDAVVPDCRPDPSLPRTAVRPLNAGQSCGRRVPSLLRGIKRQAGPLAVLVVAGLAALAAYSQYVSHERQLWTRATHDRNAHYEAGLSMALHLRQGDVREFFNDLDRARVWGPVHGLTVAGLEFMGGPDERLAVLPSLGGWMATAALACLLVRRIAGAAGGLGALVPAVLILGSPAHHAFATDVMLESMGAALSLLVLYCYLRAVQDGGRWGIPLLGLSLTVLFLYKYNYWLLTVLAIIGQELTAGFAGYSWQCRNIVATAPWRRRLASEVRRPATLLIIVLLAVWVTIHVTGGTDIAIFGQHMSVRPPGHNLITAVYVLLFVRVAQVWRRQRETIERLFTVRQMQFVRWHLLPVAVWFLWPKRLGYFLWFVGPTNGSNSESGFFGGASTYLQWVVRDYHVGWWACAAAVVLAGYAIAVGRRWRRGGLVLLWFVVLSAVLTCEHSNRKSRFVHSWIAAGWVIAGVGLAQAVEGRRRRGAVRAARYAAGVAAFSALAVLHAPSVLHAAAAPDGGPKPDRPSTLDWAESYLPDLEGAAEPMFFSNQNVKHLLWWTYRSRFPERPRPEFELNAYGGSPEQNAACFEKWLQQTSCDAIVYIHIPDDSRFHETQDESGHQQLRRMLDEQTVFRKQREYQPSRDSLTVSVWQRR